jgi:hypothetical protein
MRAPAAGAGAAHLNFAGTIIRIIIGQYYRTLSPTCGHPGLIQIDGLGTSPRSLAKSLRALLLINHSTTSLLFNVQLTSVTVCITPCAALPCKSKKAGMPCCPVPCRKASMLLLTHAALKGSGLHQHCLVRELAFGLWSFFRPRGCRA